MDTARRPPPPRRCPAVPSAAAPSDRPSAAGAPANRPPCGPTVPPRAAALLQLEHRAPLLQAVLIAAPRKSGFHPGPPRTAAVSRRTPCAAAPPHGALELAQGLDCARLLALLARRTAARDLLPQPYLPGPCHAPAYSLLSARHLASGGPLISSGTVKPEQAALAPKTAKLQL